MEPKFPAGGIESRAANLEICTVWPGTLSDQRRDLSASDREAPLITGVNGTISRALRRRTRPGH